MSAFKRLLIKNLNIPEEKEKFLPQGFQRIGTIVILNLKDPVLEYRKQIAEFVLKQFPYVKSVYVRSGKIHTEFKKPDIKWVAGEKNPVTEHKENGCLFRLDVTKLMFAKGNLRERGRVAKLAKEGETVTDMFAGIGYFSIPVAKHSKAKTIYAIEKNPTAFSFLKTNIKLNGVEKKVIPLLGDNRKVKIKEKADRILMGYFPSTRKFLQHAFDFLKNSGTIHYHDVFHKNELWEKPIQILKQEAMKKGYALKKTTYKHKVKSYAPRTYHIVIDAVFEKQ
ncbi:MAG: class I SAM-dependent methyltransferase family protein [Candidatus Aenigmatarchaeota archaeon]|nr:MAG: class I SAM-dependent methyltransferase family protein [Candidatus Aenigmarchaeota archaeon]